MSDSWVKKKAAVPLWENYERVTTMHFWFPFMNELWAGTIGSTLWKPMLLIQQRRQCLRPSEKQKLPDHQNTTCNYERIMSELWAEHERGSNSSVQRTASSVASRGTPPCFWKNLKSVQRIPTDFKGLEWFERITTEARGLQRTQKIPKDFIGFVRLS